jgi:hypothetical protein
MSRRLTYKTVVVLIVLMTALGGGRIVEYRGTRTALALEATEE